MSGVLHHLGAFCARRHVLVLILWAVLVGGFVTALATIGADTNNDLTLPGTDSQAATDLLAEDFPPQQNGGSPVVFHVVDEGAISDPANTAAVQESVTNILAIPEVHAAPDPTANPAAGLVSVDGTTAFTSVLLDVGNGELTEELAQSVLDAAEPAVDVGMQVAVGGAVGAELSQPETEQSEVIGIIAAMVILTIAFGSVIAMGLPILMAILGLVVSLGIVGMLGHLIDIAAVGPTLATMIGLGVGIDYALFIVSRHLDQLRSGMAVDESAATAVATSGGAVVFAGSTVVIALLSLAVADIPLVTSLGYACAIAVLIAVISAITLLPALMGFAGRRVISSSSLRRREARAADPRPTVWERWSGFVTGHPWLSGAVALVVLGVLIVPLFSLRLGQEDIGVTPTDTTERQAFDLLSDEFGPGYNGPLLIAMRLDPPASPSPDYLAQYEQAISLKDDLETKQATLTAQAAQLQSEQAALEAQAAQLQVQKSDLEAQAAALEAEETALRAQAAELEGEAAELRERQVALQAEQDALKAQAGRDAERLAQLEAERVRLDAEIVRLDAEIAATPDGPDKELLKAERDLTQVARDGVLAEIAATQQALRDLAVREQQLLQQAAALQQEADLLADEQAELESEAAALRADASALEEQGTQLEQQAAELEQAGAVLQQEGASLEAQQAQALDEQAVAEQLQEDITVELTQAGGDERGTDQRLTSVQTALREPPEVALVGVPQINDAGTAATLAVIATTRPADPVTAELVEQVREDILPEATAGGGIVAHVGGSTAGNVDLAAKITDKLPLVILTVLGLSFVLLMVAFRSLLVPLQAALTNLLAAAASFGVLTACFQWGWTLDLIGPESPYGSVPIASYVPLMMFAALFGLAMDYEVFFVSHVQQHHALGEDARSAVRNGLSSSMRVIVSAALIMIAVFGSFIINPDPTIKQFGVGLSVAVLLAASLTVVLAPAMLTVFGEAVFRIPAWLGRILPHVDLEGPPPSTVPVASSGQVEPSAVGSREASG